MTTTAASTSELYQRVLESGFSLSLLQQVGITTLPAFLTFQSYGLRGFYQYASPPALALDLADANAFARLTQAHRSAFDFLAVQTESLLKRRNVSSFDEASRLYYEIARHCGRIVAELGS